MPRAIVTTYTPDPEHRAQIVACCMGKQASVPYDASLTLDDNHVAAAERLARTLGWAFDWTFAVLPSGDYCHVAEVGQRQYSTVRAPTNASPAESWRARNPRAH